MSSFQIGFFRLAIFMEGFSISFQGLILTSSYYQKILLCQDVLQFIYSPIEGHIGFLQILAIMSKVTVNMYMCRFWGGHVFISFG